VRLSKLLDIAGGLDAKVRACQQLGSFVSFTHIESVGHSSTDSTDIAGHSSTDSTDTAGHSSTDSTD
jgi:hypothetical protein